MPKVGKRKRINSAEMDKNQIMELRKQLAELEAKQEHEDVAKSRKRSESDVPSRRCSTQMQDSRPRRHENDVSREPSGSMDTDRASSERSEDETSLASLVRILRRRQGRRGSVGTFEREDDANSSHNRDQSIIIDKESLISDDQGSESDLDQDICLPLFGENVVQSSKLGPPERIIGDMDGYS